MFKQIIVSFALAATGSLLVSGQEHMKSLNPDYFDKDVPVGVDFYKHVNHLLHPNMPVTDNSTF